MRYRRGWIAGIAVVVASCGAPAANGPDSVVSSVSPSSVFAGHTVRPCSELPDPVMDFVVTGELSSDPDIASAQRGRAALGFASDIETVVDVMAEEANTDNVYGIPMTPSELADLEDRGHREQRATIRAYVADHDDTFGFLYVDQKAGGVVTIGFTRGLEERRAELEQLVPDVPIDVVDAEFTHTELEEAAAPLTPAMQEGRLSLGGIATGLFRVEVYLPEPTRSDLDAIAQLTDPGKVCVRDFRATSLPEPTTSATSEETSSP